MKNQKGFTRYHSESGFVHIILILVIVTVAIIGAYYFGTLKTKSDISSFVPTPTSTSLISATKNPDILNSQNNILTMKGTLQDFMQANCKAGNPQYLDIKDLPVNIDTEIIKTLDSPGINSVYCLSTEVNTNPIKNGYLVIRLNGNVNINIYDDQSQELGHGGAPFIGFFGQKIFDKENIQMGTWIQGGDGPQVLGHVGIIIRGEKRFVTTSGQGIYVNYTQAAIPRSDTRLVNLLKPYSSIDPNIGIEEPIVNYDKDMNLKIINHFFNKTPDVVTPEGKAYQNVIKILSAITAL